MIEIFVHDRDSAKEALESLVELHTDAEPFTVTFVPHDHEPYSTTQLNRCHATFGEIAKGTRHTVKEVKTAMMLMFFAPVAFDFLGERYEFRKSFTDLNKAEASHLIDSMEAWAADNGIHIR